jgi:ribosomal protein L11 methylase PrmA
LSPGGALIISGFLRKQEKEIALAFGELGLEVLRSRESKGWACFVLGSKNGRKKAGGK